MVIAIPLSRRGRGRGRGRLLHTAIGNYVSGMPKLSENSSHSVCAFASDFGFRFLGFVVFEIARI